MDQYLLKKPDFWRSTAPGDENDPPYNLFRGILIAAALSLVFWAGVIFAAAFYIFRIWT
jgi:hypothetical protein